LIHRASTGTTEEILLEGMPLGSLKDFPYLDRSFEVSKNDTLLLMSDGFPERFNDLDEMLDYPRAYESFQKVADKSAKEIVDHLVATGEDWANGRPQDDDITFVVIKLRN
jgi:serine phosphatase RsbU (regulator of sigma subunit)